MALPAVGFFWSAVLMIVGPLVYRVVTALGVGWVTYEMSTLATDTLLDYVKGQLSGLPGDMLAIVSLLRLDDGVGIIAAAYAARAALAGWRMFEGRYQRRGMRWQKPADVLEA